MHAWIYRFLVLLYAVMLNGCNQSDDVQGQTPSSTKPKVQISASNEESMSQLDNDSDVDAKEIDWDTLIPESWQPYELMDKYNIDEISDDDPQAQELLNKLKAAWRDAPVVKTFDGQRIKLPGFVVPIEMDAKNITQFFLVPYYGACIHVPPPPANQTIYVEIRENDSFKGQLFDTVWVTGTMRVERLSSDLAEAGYRLEEASVVPFE